MLWGTRCGAPPTVMHGERISCVYAVQPDGPISTDSGNNPLPGSITTTGSFVTIRRRTPTTFSPTSLNVVNFLMTRSSSRSQSSSSASRRSGDGDLGVASCYQLALAITLLVVVVARLEAMHKRVHGRARRCRCTQRRIGVEFPHRAQRTFGQSRQMQAPRRNFDRIQRCAAARTRPVQRVGFIGHGRGADHGHVRDAVVVIARDIEHRRRTCAEAEGVFDAKRAAGRDDVKDAAAFGQAHDALGQQLDDAVARHVPRVARRPDVVPARFFARSGTSGPTSGDQSDSSPAPIWCSS